MTGLQNVIAKIFDSYGFSTRIKDELVIAEKNDAVTVVGFTTDKTTSQSLRTYLDVVKGLGLRNHTWMFAAIGEIAEDAKELARAKKITLWERENMEWEIGRVVLKELLESDTEKETLHEFFSKLSSDLLERELLNALEQKKQAKLELVPEYNETIIKPKVGLEAIRDLGHREVRGFEYRLELVPYYLYEYTCELVVESAESEKKKGLVGVNGLTRECEDWKAPYEYIQNLNQSHTKLEPKLDEEKAARLAKQFVVDLHTSVRENRMEKGSALIIERKKVRPKEESVSLKLHGLVYLPLWCVEGSEGVMILNAATGKIIREDFYK